MRAPLNKLLIAAVFACAVLAAPRESLAQDPAGPANAAPKDPAAAAEVVSPLAQLVDALAEVERRLQALEKDLAAAKGEEKQAVLSHLRETRDEKRKSTGALIEAIAGVSWDGGSVPKAARDAAESAIKEDLLQAAQDYVDAEDELESTREAVAAEPEPGKKIELEGELHASNERLVALLEHTSKNLEQHRDLGLDPARAAARLDERLARRGRRLGALLHVTAEELDTNAKRAAANDEQRGAQENERVLLQERLDALGALLGRVIALMKARGLEATDLQQLLIESTGRVTADVLDVDVGVGLLQAWWVKVKAWSADMLPRFGFGVLVFVLILLVARALAWLMRKFARRLVKRSRMSELAKDFVVGSAGRAVMVAGLLIALAQVGVQMGPMLAGLGIAGFIIGFALQDTLGNFASGMLILMYRPFDVGDLVEVAGIQGKVAEMTLVSTSIMTLDNQRLIVPNSKIWNGVIRNMTSEAVRRVDFTFGVSYEDDIDEVEALLREIVAAEPRIHTEPEVVVALHELADSSVNFVVRGWTDTDNYWPVFWATNAAVKRRFDAEGVSIPYPQRDVHLQGQTNG